MKRGDIYLADLDPASGFEIKKTRPVIIFQNNVSLEVSGTVTVLPVSSKPFLNRIYEVRLIKDFKNKLFRDSKVFVHQIRTLDKKRLKKKIGQIEADVLREMEEKLLIHLGIVSIEDD